MPTRATCPFETGAVCSDRRCQDDYRHARSPDPPLRHHRDRQHQLAIQKPQLTKPSPGPPPGLTHVGAQEPPTRAATSLVGALRVARGSLLCTTWISPIPSPQRGHDWTRKGGRVWMRIDTHGSRPAMAWRVTDKHV